MLYELTPFLVEKVWGGKMISSFFNSDPGKKWGEAWIASTLPEGQSLVGKTPLGSLISPLSYLVKILDTTDNLSLQVHPGDQYARKVEGSTGKSECWVILDAKPGAGLFLGLQEGVSKEQLLHAISHDDPTQLMTFYPVQPGDFYFVPAGTIHAIGSDITLIETQQSSGVTYRVWDWGRSGRELHLDKAMDVINFKSSANTIDFFDMKRNLFATKASVELVRHPDFNLDIHTFEASKQTTFSSPRYPVTLVLLKGQATIVLGSQEKMMKLYQAYMVTEGEGLRIVSEKTSVLAIIY